LFFVDMVMLVTGETGFKRFPRLRPVHRLLFGMASAPFQEANGGKCYRKFSKSSSLLRRGLAFAAWGGLPDEVLQLLP
jgi:hypothetical protein